jgi:hypothetical protein
MDCRAENSKQIQEFRSFEFLSNRKRWNALFLRSNLVDPSKKEIQMTKFKLDSKKQKTRGKRIDFFSKKSRGLRN